MADVAVAVPGAERADVERLGSDLLRRWSEPHRRYHDVAHLTEVLAAADVLARGGRGNRAERSAVILAAWFHDAVYEGRGGDDERRSAALAARELGVLGADEALVDRVVTLVLDTVEHDIADAAADDGPDADRAILHDADLWILASPTPRFDEYCRQVREEYAHVPVAEYTVGRAAVLRPFLVRPHVYRSELARREWEPAARENLARELTRLAG
ncbi:metal-dependent phosphohydrolase [Arthrobacter sp. NEB 688]|uniref:HD domain-containing protein n=1 Tax=Arthrobacter sp. NEB 688 TaxID=904039 RepID=UPI001564D297|nr:metal-dependent phosphohydrolase [Arthrobacter sp. NEB 688]QKE82585.1 metal-dependent phosphohydrolase [Arthrobacter sp. NEB 688]